MQKQTFTVYGCSKCGCYHTEKTYQKRHVNTCGDDTCGAMLTVREATLTKPAEKPDTPEAYVYTCCNSVSSLKSRLRRHGCDNVPTPRIAYIVSATTAAAAAEVRRRRRRTPEEILRGVATSGLDIDSDNTQSFDERIDYLCEITEVLQQCFWDNTMRRTPISTSVEMFRHLWGDLAPERFRSFVCRCNVLYEVVDEGIVKRETPEDVREVVINVFQAVNDLADAVIARRPDYAEIARYFKQRLEGSPPMGTLDVLKRNDMYDMYRRKCEYRVKFANSFAQNIRTLLKQQTRT